MSHAYDFLPCLNDAGRINELESALAQARQERDEAARLTQDAFDERDTLRAALRKYGQHHWKCAALAQAIKVGEWCCAEPKRAKEIMKEIESLPTRLPCTCGLTDALGGTDG